MALNKYTKGGSSGLERKLDAIVEDLYKLQIVPSSTIQVEQKSHGTILTANVRGGGGSQIATFRYKSMQDDYLVCRTWDWTTEGDTDVLIAKPYDLRMTGWNGVTVVYPSEFSGSVSVLYTKVSSSHRTATSGSEIEDQAIRPFYVPDKSVIFAMNAETGISEVGWIDLNVDARAFAKIR